MDRPLLARCAELTAMVDSRRLDEVQRMLERNLSDQALAALREAEREDGNEDRRWCHLMSVTMLAQGRLQDCVEYGHKALALGEHTSTRVNLAVALIMAGSFEKAVDVLSPVASPDAGVLVLLSEPLIRLGRLEQAELALRRAARFDCDEGRTAKSRLERLNAGLVFSKYGARQLLRGSGPAAIRRARVRHVAGTAT